MQPAQAQNQGAFPPSFQPPANMPNINFSAPVIRLGMSGPKGDAGGRGFGQDQGPRRGGLGFDGRDGPRDRLRENMQLSPPTREEVARTIFIGNITDGVGGDEGMQRILASAGGLRRWQRAIDQDGKSCTFGFAEFEDADSLAVAMEVFEDVEVPVKRVTADAKPDEEIAKTKLLVRAVRRIH
ncbi:hypothetical protein MRB53_039435 [Persea americana]|nr:hypothetical protein MRB53_039435 [Persea americana]